MMLIGFAGLTFDGDRRGRKEARRKWPPRRPSGDAVSCPGPHGIPRHRVEGPPPFWLEDRRHRLDAERRCKTKSERRPDDTNRDQDVS
jgi:hypothetical protein